MGPQVHSACNFSQCNLLLLSDQAAANIHSYIQYCQPEATFEHEARTCHTPKNQLFYLPSHSIDAEVVVSMLVSGFCRDVFNKLPMEFAAETDKLLALKLQGFVGNVLLLLIFLNFSSRSLTSTETTTCHEAPIQRGNQLQCFLSCLFMHLHPHALLKCTKK